MKRKINKLFPIFLNQLGGRKSPRNRELYEKRLALFLDMYGDLAADEVDGGQIGEWLEIISARGYTPATMAGYRQAIKAFFNYLVNEEIIDRSPARRLKIGTTISQRRKLPVENHLRRAEALAIEWMMRGKDEQVRNGAIFALCTRCGLRSQEIRSLKLSEVQRALQRGPNQFGYYEAATAGKTGEAMARFDQIVADGLDRYLAEFRPKKARINICFIPNRRTRTKADSELRWRMLTRSALDNIFVNLCKAAGVPIIRPHLIRHWVGTRITREQNAKTAARVLNHADWQTAATALRYYAHVDESDIGAAIGANVWPGTDDESAALNQLFGVE